jgi:hypothetical protein
VCGYDTTTLLGRTYRAGLSFYKPLAHAIKRIVAGGFLFFPTTQSKISVLSFTTSVFFHDEMRASF